MWRNSPIWSPIRYIKAWVIGTECTCLDVCVYIRGRMKIMGLVYSQIWTHRRGKKFSLQVCILMESGPSWISLGNNNDSLIHNIFFNSRVRYEYFRTTRFSLKIHVRAFFPFEMHPGVGRMTHFGTARIHWVNLTQCVLHPSTISFYWKKRSTLHEIQKI